MKAQAIIYQARLHKVIFFSPLLFVIVSLCIGIFIPETYLLVFIFLGLACIWLLETWLRYQATIVIVNNIKLMVRTGFFSKNWLDIPLDKIASLDVRQTILGSIFQYGSILITVTGGVRESVSYLARPLTLRRHIEECMQS